MVAADEYGRRWKARRRKILDRDGWRCGWCEQDLRAKTYPDGGRLRASVDHIVSLVEGKRLGWTLAQLNDESNLCAACDRCNSSRSHRPGPPKSTRSRSKSSSSSTGPFLVTTAPTGAAIRNPSPRVRTVRAPEDPQQSQRWTIEPRRTDGGQK